MKQTEKKMDMLKTHVVLQASKVKNIEYRMQ